MNESLIGFRLFGGEAAELGEQPWGNADSNQLLGVPSHGPSHPPGAAELFVGGFRNIRKVQPAIRHMLGVLCALLGAR